MKAGQWPAIVDKTESVSPLLFQSAARHYRPIARRPKYGRLRPELQPECRHEL